MSLSDRNSITLRSGLNRWGRRCPISFLAVALHGEPFNLAGEWVWPTLLSTHKHLAGGTFVKSKPPNGKEGSEAFEVSGDDWFDLVGHNEGLIDDIQALGKWLSTALQVEVDREFIGQATPRSPGHNTSHRL